MATSDRRRRDSAKTNARYEFAQQSWATGDGHAAKTATLANVNMLIERIDVIISSVTANPTVNVVITDGNSVEVVDKTNLTTLADGTNHILLSTKATPDFAASPIADDTLTVSIDPSADPGGAAQILTVDVILRGP